MFREQIRKQYEHLSRSYRRVADFILNDYQSVAFMTAATLADTADVDTTTVVRFAQRLGYPGYPGLVNDIRKQVKLELSQSYATATEEDSLRGKVQNLVVQDRANLEKALAHNTLDTIENILDLLQAAPKIVVIGESYAAPLAEMFAGMLRDAGMPVVYASSDVYDRAVALAHLTRKEVVIGMSPLEGPSGVAKVMRYVRDEGAISLACAPSLNSETARAASHLLYAPGESTGTLPSLTGLYSICTAIAQGLATLKPEERAKQKAAVNRTLKALT